MKTNHTDEQLQSAIDAACKAAHTQFNAKIGNSIAISPERVPACWGDEYEARLHLLKTSLDLLPEPPPPVVDGKTPEPPAEIPWTEWHGGECPLKDEEVEEWQWKCREGYESLACTALHDKPQTKRWNHAQEPFDIIAYRVLKWRDGCGPDAVDWKAKYEEAQTKLEQITPITNDDIRVMRDIVLAREEAETRAEKAEADLADAIEEVENRREALLSAASQIDELKARADRWFNQAKAENGKYLTAVEEIARLQKDTLSNLRPISEAGPVPAGCVRFYFYKQEGKWSWGSSDKTNDDTHFADILKPVEPTPEVVQDGGEVFEVATPEPAKEWTPKVGDVVRLKSGGPKLTVIDFHKDGRAICNYFDGSRLCTPYFPVATLQPA